VFGPNGIQFMADGRTLLFANTASNPMAGNPLTGRLYTVAVQPNGSAGKLTQVWESLPLDGPDGFAIARSGNVYIALAGANQIVLLSPQFAELARAPSDPAANQAEEVPLDAPASLAFLGQRLLMTNHSAIRGDSSSWAVLDVFAGERGLPLFYPRISRPALRLGARALSPARGACARIRVHVTRHLASKDVPVGGATARAGGARARTDARGAATLTLRRSFIGPVVVSARKPGFTAAKAAVRVRPACADGGGSGDRD
jgi:SMP-30/gluconolaconase/LRE-like protein